MWIYSHLHKLGPGDMGVEEFVSNSVRKLDGKRHPVAGLLETEKRLHAKKILVEVPAREGAIVVAVHLN